MMWFAREQMQRDAITCTVSARSLWEAAENLGINLTVIMKINMRPLQNLTYMWQIVSVYPFICPTCIISKSIESYRRKLVSEINLKGEFNFDS
jgi:hypothetical protein